MRTDRGIVQSVSATGLVLKTLDGGRVAVRVDAKTRVFVNGTSASLHRLAPGFVAVVTYVVGKRGAKKNAKKNVAGADQRLERLAALRPRPTVSKVHRSRRHVLELGRVEGRLRLAEPLGKRRLAHDVTLESAATSSACEQLAGSTPRARRSRYASSSTAWPLSTSTSS